MTDINDKIDFLITKGDDILGTLKNGSVDSVMLESWRNSIITFTAECFGKNSDIYHFFNKDMNVGMGRPYVYFTRMYRKRLEDLKSELIHGIVKKPNITDDADIKKLENIFYKFSLVASQLSVRYSSRLTIKIDDEYDVQDLLHAILKLYFDDIRPEEWCPSYAGKKARTDFLLENEKIFIEVKKTNSKLKDKELTEQLIEDRSVYSKHQNCQTLVCFVYDPERLIRNKAGIIKDIENTSDLNVKVFIEN